MEQMDEAWIELQAVNDATNTQRSYILDVSRDLFGYWLVTRRWGRIGARRQSVTNAFKDTAARDTFLRTTLRNRKSARRRLGAGYAPVDGSPSALGVFGRFMMGV